MGSLWNKNKKTNCTRRNRVEEQKSSKCLCLCLAARSKRNSILQDNLFEYEDWNVSGAYTVCKVNYRYYFVCTVVDHKKWVRPAIGYAENNCLWMRNTVKCVLIYSNGDTISPNKMRTMCRNRRELEYYKNALGFIVYLNNWINSQ